MKTASQTMAIAAFALVMLTAPVFADTVSATGRVTKIEEGAGKVTIKQGPVKALDMPDPMTMVYRVKDPASLKSLKSGDNVKFDVEHDTSGYIVTHIEKE